MTPAGRTGAVLELLEALAAAPRRPADAIAHEYLRARRFIGAADRRAITDLAWGVVREQARLAWWVSRCGGRPEPRSLLIAYHALVLRQDPALLFGAGRFAPAPLTPAEAALAARLRGQPLRHPDQPPEVALNIPAWALPGLTARFGADLPAEAAALEAEAPLDLRVNLLKTSREAARAALAEEGIATEPTPYSPWGLRAPKRAPVMATRAFRSGLIEVQDEGSQIIAALVDARPGMRVLDLCAGAAGKTLALAMTMGNRGRISACDVSAARLAGAARRLARAGVDNAETRLLAPGDRWAKRQARSFDRVLADAPCTGTGTWRRNPDARYRMGETDLRELLAIQHDILVTAADLTRPGGLLVYATCSLLPAEDEEQVERLLARSSDFEPVPLPEAWAAAGLPGAPPCPGPWLVMTPARCGTDGFFAAVLRRRT
ncbi:MAG: RsmB/NOP family class I SAM-dependent RNA methyltransferase [Rhodovarius sp.]|nr:RsmB/NOP family class I SAM-dependent RNA methyltransferase [Rhodovarius sp.]